MRQQQRGPFESASCDEYASPVYVRCPCGLSPTAPVPARFVRVDSLLYSSTVHTYKVPVAATAQSLLTVCCILRMLGMHSYGFGIREPPVGALPAYLAALATCGKSADPTPASSTRRSRPEYTASNPTLIYSKVAPPLAPTR